MDETSRDLSIGVCSFGKSGASLILNRSSLVVNFFLSSLSKRSSKAQINADVKDAFPGLRVTPLGEVAARYSNDLRAVSVLRIFNKKETTYRVLRSPPNRPRSPA